jgi:hypothetical protein
MVEALRPRVGPSFVPTSPIRVALLQRSNVILPWPAAWAWFRLKGPNDGGRFGRLKPQHIVIAAAVGWTRPLLFRQPRVVVISTGDELVPPEERPRTSQIHHSNSDPLCVQARHAGAVASSYGTLRHFPGVNHWRQPAHVDVVGSEQGPPSGIKKRGLHRREARRQWQTKGNVLRLRRGGLNMLRAGDV